MCSALLLVAWWRWWHSGYDAVSVEGEFADADGVADTGVVAVGAASRRGSHDGMGRLSEPREVGEES